MKIHQKYSKNMIKNNYQNMGLYGWGELKSLKTRSFTRVESARAKSTFPHPQVWGGLGLQKNVRRPVLRV